MEAREKILEGLRELKEIMEETEQPAKNRCWWDMGVCLYFSEIRGLQEATARCGSCSRLDGKRFITILEGIFSGLLDKVELEKIPHLKGKLEEAQQKGHQERYEEGKEEKVKEMEDEIYDSIFEHFNNLKSSLEELKKKSHR